MDVAMLDSSLLSISQAFERYFALEIADTPAQLADVYRLRYKVYCAELHYEREEDCPGGRERDLFDARSIHCLLRHRSSNRYAGTVRLVLADRTVPEAVFPFESFCYGSLNQHGRALLQRPRTCLGEVSRLAVTADFRKRRGERSSAAGVPEGDGMTQMERRSVPLIALGLCLAATSLGMQGGLDCIFAMMEPRLARHLRRFGIRFRQVGDLTDYHGTRGPFFISREQVLNELNPDVKELLDYITSQIPLRSVPGFD
ncbi:MAG: PEP-CTERM/exosortase system-associated acyltransferase [Cyanobacteria bacterium J06639_1]